MAGTIAIDLGSTTTVVAYQPPGEEPTVLALPPYSLDDPCVVPSLLWLAAADVNKALLGRQVLDANLAHGDGPQLQRDFKRLIGRPSQPPLEAGACGLPLSPEQAGARLLRQLWDALPAGIEPERLVLTAPIDTYAGYRDWLTELAGELGVSEVALVDEPTAAAIGCGLAPGSTVLVVDLGGGTSDLSLVQLPGGEGRAAPIAQLLRLRGQSLAASRQQLRCARVLGKAGLAIGGRDIDRWIAAHLCPQAAVEGPLLAVAERLKCQLSTQPLARSAWIGPEGTVQQLELSRLDLEALLLEQGLIEQLDGLLEAVLSQGRNAGVDSDRIDAVLPVGGSSRLAPIQSWLAERLAGIPVRNQRPVEAVALGALALTPGVRIRDVLSRGVSLRCWDRRSQSHRWHPLFVAGQHWPTDQPLELVLACSRDQQETMEIVLGEPQSRQRAEVVFEQGLPRLRQPIGAGQEVQRWSQQPQPLRVNPPGSTAQDRLRLRFSIDADCRLTLQAQDLLNDAAELQSMVLGTLR